MENEVKDRCEARGYKRELSRQGVIPRCWSLLAETMQLESAVMVSW